MSDVLDSDSSKMDTARRALREAEAACTEALRLEHSGSIGSALDSWQGLFGPTFAFNGNDGFGDPFGKQQARSILSGLADETTFENELVLGAVLAAGVSARGTMNLTRLMDKLPLTGMNVGEPGAMDLHLNVQGVRVQKSNKYPTDERQSGIKRAYMRLRGKRL